MSEPIAEILAKCLDRMEAGASLESCLADFPKQAAELEPLLKLTRQMNHLSNVGPRPTFARNARLQLENQLMTSGTAVTFKQLNRHTRQEHNLLQRRFSMSMLQLILATMLALTATTAGAAYAANASNPGDFLHGLDLAMENAQLNLAPDVWSKVQLRLEFASERLAEAQATFSANDPADGLEAMNEYGTEISAIAQTIGSADGADQEALALLVETAQGVHKDVLTKLLDKVPEQAQQSIQNAIEASHASENIPGLAPDNAGAPEGVGAPDSAGAPNGVGVPDDAPGIDISACAKSLSKETAHTLVDLAKEHGVDHQYVLESFCTLGTLEQVSEMLSELGVPPGGVPAGPPTDVPAGPPADTPGGRPSDPPGGAPSDTPGGPPIHPPGKP